MGAAAAAPSRVGDAVFVRRSKCGTGARATVTVPQLPDPQGGKPRLRATYADGTAYDARVVRCVPVYGAERSFVLTGETDEFRQLARTQLGEGDFVLEIGSSYGDATASLLRTPGVTVLGLDTSKECVEVAEKALAAERAAGRVSFEVSDCVREWPELRARFAAAPPAAVFIDIGGDRAFDTVLAVVELVERDLKPRLVVVKCRELYRLAKAWCAARGPAAVPADMGPAAPVRSAEAFWRAMEAKTGAMQAERAAFSRWLK